MTRSVLLGLLIFIASIGAVAGAAVERIATTPRCQEDAVLIGTGDFQGGRWTAYACGPAVDDFQP